MLRVTSSSMPRYACARRSRFGAQRHAGDQVDRPTEQILEMELHPEVLRGGRGSAEPDEDVHVAVLVRGIASDGPEQDELDDAETALRIRPRRPEQCECGPQIHGGTLGAVYGRRIARMRPRRAACVATLSCSFSRTTVRALENRPARMPFVHPV